MLNYKFFTYHSKPFKIWPQPTLPASLLLFFKVPETLVMAIFLQHLGCHILSCFHDFAYFVASAWLSPPSSLPSLPSPHLPDEPTLTFPESENVIFPRKPSLLPHSKSFVLFPLCYLSIFSTLPHYSTDHMGFNLMSLLLPVDCGMPDCSEQLCFMFIVPGLIPCFIELNVFLKGIWKHASPRN